MSSRRPNREGLGKALPDIGRARRYLRARPDGATTELFVLPAADEALAQRLAAFGAERLGGFDEPPSRDEELVLIERRIPAQTMDALAKEERLEASLALAKIRDLARALAACEASGVFPGPLRPQEIALGSGGRAEAWFLAGAWVETLLGHVKAPGSKASGPSPRFTPPEQVSGAPWDNAANRYVLGLVAYRLLSGSHPFAGGGLRDAMDAQAALAPPFADEVARTLRPGIQSLVLSLLDPDQAKRPAKASVVVRRCEELLRGDLRPEERGPPSRASHPSHELARPPAPSPAPAEGRPLGARRRKAVRRRTAEGGRRARLRVAGPIVVGGVMLLTGLASSRGSAERREQGEHGDAKPAPAPALARAPMQTTTAETCAPCHARHVAEWQRSVMAHASRSPLFGALESLVEEQIGRDERCPNGAGVLRKRGTDSCRDERTGQSLTGAGGEHWCVNCHAAADNLGSVMPPWSAASFSSAARKPLRDLLAAQALEGISCAVCHQSIGPVHGRGTARYEGNPTWTSAVTGASFSMRPEDGRGLFGISNSGYQLDRESLVTTRLGAGTSGDPIVHKRASTEARAYVASSQFCGACHDVRLFGTDTLGVRDRGEHFKRLRNAYSEWKSWAEGEKAAGRRAASCQDCHMSLYPGVCVPDVASKGGAECPGGFRFEARGPGEKPRGMIASSSSESRPLSVHYFTSVDLPLANEFPDVWASDSAVDASGLPLGLELRRTQMLRHTFRFSVEGALRVGSRIEIPIEIQNVGAGHRVPAGFSQEREIWVEMTLTDGRGATVYEVGKIPNDEADLRDKIFLRVNTRDDALDRKGRPLGVFGADVVDGPDVPRWAPNPALGGTLFRGRGLVNLQNGFLRCVRCIGVIDESGTCRPGPGQGRTRADRFDDGVYDIDTGECASNLRGTNALFETYFPVGALDAERGVAKAPDAILDTRSAPPQARLRYVYELDAGGRTGPFTVKARLRFRPFPPFLLRAFADYEARKAAAGLRPSGAQLALGMLRRNKPVDLAETTVTFDGR